MTEVYPVELLTRQELSKQLRIKPDTVSDWVRRGLIPVIRVNGRVLRFDPEAVHRALMTKKEETDCGS